MNVKHTPGPWPIWAGERAGFTHIAIGHIASMRPAYVETQSPDAEVMKANAKLIAAAPDMLAAARQAIMSHMRYGKVMERDVRALIDAIAKAEGGAA